MEKKMCRILMALSLFLTLSFLCSTTAYAGATRNPVEDAVANTHMGEMADRFFGVYVFFRSKIAIPLVIVSIASCGFRVLGGVLFDGPQNPLGPVFKQFVQSIVALFALMFLPHVLGAAIDMFEATAWKPNCIFLPFTMITGGWP